MWVLKTSRWDLEESSAWKLERQKHMSILTWRSVAFSDFRFETVIFAVLMAPPNDKDIMIDVAYFLRSSLRATMTHGR